MGKPSARAQMERDGPQAPPPQLTHSWVQQEAFPAQRGPRQLPHLLSHPRPVLRWSLVHLCLCLCFQAPRQKAAHLYTDIHTHTSVRCTHVGTHVRRSTGNQEAAPWPQETGSLPGLVISAWASGGSCPLAVCLWPPLSEDPQNKGAGCGDHVCKDAQR